MLHAIGLYSLLKVLENNWRRKFAVSLTLTQGFREEKYLKPQKGVDIGPE